MKSTTQVWLGEEFLGRIDITEADFAACPEGRENWRTAARIAARRVFGPEPAGRGYHVDELGPVIW